jgi:hypothetical protein
MRKYGTALALLCAAFFLTSAKKPDPAKFIPPAHSHGKAITGYGCDKQKVTERAGGTSNSSIWDLIVWAQYGTERKRYWEKTYGTYQIADKSTFGSSGETASGGAPIGGYANEGYDFTPMDKACSEWSAEMETSFPTKLQSTGKPQ